MKKSFLLVFLLASLWSCQSSTDDANQSATDSDGAKQEEQKPEQAVLSPVEHGSLVITWNGKTIYVDPAWGAEKYMEYPAPDLVLISHPHGDHCSPETLEGLETSKAVLVLPTAKEAHEKTEAISFQKKETLANGQTMDWEGMKIEAVPMYNLPEDETSRHVKGWGNGYVLHIGGQKIYISGDTEDIAEMRNLKDIDVAFVCMNLPYTMTVDQAVDAVAEFKPKTVYPYHYRGKDPKYSDIEKFKADLAVKAPEVEVILAKWY